MNRAPAFLCQRHYGGALYAGEFGNYLTEAVVRNIHHNVFFTLGGLDCIKAEQQFLKNGFFLSIQIGVANKESLGLHYNLYLTQVVAYQCGA